MPLIRFLALSALGQAVRASPGKVSFGGEARVVLPKCKKPPLSVRHRGLRYICETLLLAGRRFLLLGCWRCAFVFASPALASAFRTLLRVGVELCLLFRRQDGANLRLLLSAVRRILHYLMRLFHVGAERGGVTLLAGVAGRVHERLRLSAKCVVLRLILLANRLDLRLLRVGQIEIASKSFAATRATTTIGAGIRTARGHC